MTSSTGTRTETPAPSAQHARLVGLDPARMPRHVAMIMDGNGRWARSQGWDRTLGHRSGADIVRAITTESVALGISRLTLYAFSSENWSRPRAEVDFLMGLLAQFLRQELPTLMDNGVRLEAIGRLERLPAEVRAILDQTIDAASANKRMTLCLALSYGGREEIADACQAVVRAVAAGELPADAVTPEAIQARLYAPHAPDVDLVIRTAGEQRLSNFLPWQAIYAEYVSVEALWPDFTVARYHDALREFQKRERRFGGV
jgi:undecaprenyl diphosphate synthase